MGGPLGSCLSLEQNNLAGLPAGCAVAKNEGFIAGVSTRGRSAAPSWGGNRYYYDRMVRCNSMGCVTYPAIRDLPTVEAEGICDLPTGRL
jgi:hypothetical protein